MEVEAGGGNVQGSSRNLNSITGEKEGFRATSSLLQKYGEAGNCFIIGKPSGIEEQ